MGHDASMPFTCLYQRTLIQKWAVLLKQCALVKMYITIED